MTKKEFVNVKLHSMINPSAPTRNFKLNLDEVESLRIELEKNGDVYYSIFLSNKRILRVDDKDGMTVIEKLREKTAREYAKKK